METTIDRASYRRENLKMKEEVKEEKRIKKLVLNEVIISMAILISILIIKILNLSQAYEWIDKELNTGMPFEELKQYAIEKVQNANSIFLAEKIVPQDSNINIDINDMNDTTLENTNANIETQNAETNKEYETAVEGINQLSEDAKYIKENYNLLVPVEGIITSRFGSRVSDNPIVSSYHTGLDIGANTGATIIASHDGKIIEAGNISGYGKCIMIEQDDLITVYAHCSKINVKKGDNTKQGDKIGEVGMTGNATGPHVHFEIRYKERFVNPEDII